MFKTLTAEEIARSTNPRGIDRHGSAVRTVKAEILRYFVDLDGESVHVDWQSYRAVSERLTDPNR